MDPGCGTGVVESGTACVYQCSWTYNVHNTSMSVMSVVVTEQGLVILLGLTLLAQEACMYICMYVILNNL